MDEKRVLATYRQRRFASFGLVTANRKSAHNFRMGRYRFTTQRPM
jgi:hypothetical protein